MQYIQTKYLPPTGTKKGRIKAMASFCSASLITDYDHSLDCEQAHAKAAMQLATKLEWLGKYASGGNDSGYVFCFIGNSNIYTTEE